MLSRDTYFRRELDDDDGFDSQGRGALRNIASRILEVWKEATEDGYMQLSRGKPGLFIRGPYEAKENKTVTSFYARWEI